MAPIRLGIIGCGIAGHRLHLPALKQLTDQFQITVVCNHTEPKAKSFAEEVGGVPYMLDYNDLLAREDVDAVAILLPIHLNYEVTRAALEAGKHVLLEKPLAASLQQAEKLVSLANQYSQVKLLAENFRYRTTFQKAKELMDEGKIGTPYGVIWNILQYVHADTSPYANTQWRINHQYPGGFLTDGGVHFVGALRTMFEEITTVNARVQSINPEVGEMDTLMLQFGAGNHFNGELNFYCSANGLTEDTMYILGNEGSMEVKEGQIKIKRVGKEEQVEQVEDTGGFKEEWLDFYAAIREGEPVKSPFEEGYKDLKVVLTALESAKSGTIKTTNL